MTSTVHPLEDLESRVAAGEPLTRLDAERVLATPDLVSVGALGERARRRRSGARVTFGRVAHVRGGETPVVERAGEVRIDGAPESIDQAVAWVRAAATAAAGAPVTGFSLPVLIALARGVGAELTGVSRLLREAGLEAVGDVPVDRFESTAGLIAAIEALVAGGLGAWRATVDRAEPGERLDLVERIAAVQAATGAIRAFAPLPRHDAAAAPSTGYDDVRTVAVAAVVGAAIPFIQVDWPLYGPKLAQVAITFGANDIDGVDAVDSLAEGVRRAAGEDLARQIRAASAEPAERNGRYEIRS